MGTLQAFIHTMRYEADGVISLDLRPAAGGTFPAFEAGSHVDLHLPNGMVRQYSLSNDPSERHRYVVGVLRDRASRGGSSTVHDVVRVGQKLTISEPRNNFALHEGAPHSVLVAGGIGVTPILAMARRLQALGRPFTVLYFARSRSGAAFLDELQAMGAPLVLHFDDEKGGPPDIRALLLRAEQGAAAHYYACGPAPMLDGFEKACVSLGYPNAHIERFAAVESEAAPDARSTYTVELRRSGRSITITPARSLLDSLLDAGVQVDNSCCEGICGTCETRVLAGEPDHRDSVLSPAERGGNKVMMVCVSGCKSATLALDL